MSAEYTPIIARFEMEDPRYGTEEDRRVVRNLKELELILLIASSIPEFEMNDTKIPEYEVRSILEEREAEGSLSQ